MNGDLSPGYILLKFLAGWCRPAGVSWANEVRMHATRVDPRKEELWNATTIQAIRMDVRVVWSWFFRAPEADVRTTTQLTKDLISSQDERSYVGSNVDGSGSDQRSLTKVLRGDACPWKISAPHGAVRGAIADGSTSYFWITNRSLYTFAPAVMFTR